MKKGFTLAELLCVIIILSMLILLAIPSINNIINDEEKNISDAMKNIVIQASELYIQDNNSYYIKKEGNIYCIAFEELISAERLEKPLKDPISGKQLDTNKYVKVSIKNQSYEYEIVNECTSIE